MLRRGLLAFLCASLLVAPASATWSIVVVNRRTGEVAVGSATCIARINLLSGLTSVVPGVGAGVIQASGDSSDLLPMTEAFRLGLAPADILVLVRAAESSPNLLQTGIVSFYPGAPVTFSGRGVGTAKAGVVGEVGDLAYAIQGNVLAGTEVVSAAEAALLNTNGDLGQKLMAAMIAARTFGGDGRCSCNFGHPDRCGSPPAQFEKSAHVGFVVVTRVGDDVPPCVQPNGNDCSQGRFYLRLNIRGADADENDPDPVDQLAALYATWRVDRAGRPDGVRSTVTAVDALPADGRTKRVVTVRLVDLEGVPLDHGGASVSVESEGGARLNTIPGSVVDMGDGSYRFTLTATTHVGTDRLRIRAEDDLVRATLYPALEVRSEPPAALHVGVDALSASAGGTAPFVLSRPDFAGAGYLILASASGTVPGTPLGSAGILPLVRDRWFGLSALHANDPAVLPGSAGRLDADGRAEASFVADPGELLPLIGTRLSWAAVVSDGTHAATTEAVGFDVVP
jgi:hypothetical protein